MRAAIVLADEAAGVAAVDEEAFRLDVDLTHLSKHFSTIGTAATHFLGAGQVEQHRPDRALQAELGI
ncbi:MAG TPA: hypothetical protein VEB65_12635, partial [Solirubrobacterales bacterium]|nr:hypothetical protein [Solirubrobacterales bacterium]